MNMMKTIARSRGLAVQTVLSVLALGCAALPALANDIDAPQRAVRFSDLDVAQTRGASVLYRRISSAAEKVCSRLDRRDLSSQIRFKACVARAIENAVVQVDKPMLLAVHVARQPKSRLSGASLEAGQG